MHYKKIKNKKGEKERVQVTCLFLEIVSNLRKNQNSGKFDGDTEMKIPECI